MKTTLDLLKAAIAAEPATTKAEWARRLGVERTAINVAEQRGHLSPTLAGQLANYLGEPVAKWTALAALEAAKQSPATTKLRRILTAAGS